MLDKYATSRYYIVVDDIKGPPCDISLEILSEQCMPRIISNMPTSPEQFKEDRNPGDQGHLKSEGPKTPSSTDQKQRPTEQRPRADGSNQHTGQSQNRDQNTSETPANDRQNKIRVHLTMDVGSIPCNSCSGMKDSLMW